MNVFSYKQGERLAEAFNRRGVEYLFIGKSGAVFYGFPETTQDADAEAKNRSLLIAGKFPVASLDDIIASKRAANRAKDRESLPRLEAFRDYLRSRNLTALPTNPMQNSGQP